VLGNTLHNIAFCFSSGCEEQQCEHAEAAQPAEPNTTRR